MTTSPPLTFDAISRSCRDLPDSKIAAIESTGGSFSDLEIALGWATGENDVMGEERLPLAGKALRIYEILISEESEWSED